MLAHPTPTTPLLSEVNDLLYPLPFYLRPPPHLAARFFYSNQIHRADKLRQETFNYGPGGSATPPQTRHAASCTVGIGGPPDPGDFAGGGPHGSKQGSVALIPSQGESGARCVGLENLCLLTVWRA